MVSLPRQAAGGDRSYRVEVWGATASDLATETTGDVIVPTVGRDTIKVNGGATMSVLTRLPPRISCRIALTLQASSEIGGASVLTGQQQNRCQSLARGVRGKSIAGSLLSVFCGTSHHRQGI